MKIVECKISEMPKTMFGPMPVVSVTFEDGTTTDLFSYYPDEISFNEQEFIGLTSKEACHLKFVKDSNFLRS